MKPIVLFPVSTFGCKSRRWIFMVDGGRDGKEELIRGSSKSCIVDNWPLISLQPGYYCAYPRRQRGTPYVRLSLSVWSSCTKYCPIPITAYHYRCPRHGLVFGWLLKALSHGAISGYRMAEPYRGAWT